jgi:hypothetical protein
MLSTFRLIPCAGFLMVTALVLSSTAHFTRFLPIDVQRANDHSLAEKVQMLLDWIIAQE